MIISFEIHNKDVVVKVSFRCFFNLINITKVVYPISKTSEDIKSDSKNKEENKKAKSLYLKKIEIEDLIIILGLISKIKILEIYSDLDYGYDVIEITSFLYVLINTIYGNIFSYFDAKEMNLKVTTCYTRDYIDYMGRVHIKPNLRDVIIIAIAMFKIYKKIKAYTKIKNSKEEELDEISQLHKKFNGYNSGVN